MTETLTLKSILSDFHLRWEAAPDVRKPNNNTQYQMVDGILSAFSVFFMQSRSFLAHQRLMQCKKGKNNAASLFRVERLPSDPQIRNLLDPLSVQYFHADFWHGSLKLDMIRQLQEPPGPFTPGEPLFWDDIHISAQMLSAHLNPMNDLASRRPETIDRSVYWLVQTLGLHTGSAVLDLGCGPGLYAARLAQQGIRVTGVDYSRRSIEYAIQSAQQQKLDIEYRYQNYLDLADSELYDAALLIYGDFCPLSPGERSQLLRNVHRALKPGGLFVLDVTTREHRKQHGSVNGWYVSKSSFWKPETHLVLEQGFDYPEQSIFLDQAIVIEANGRLSVYRMWFQDFTRESITDELEKGAFTVQSVWSDLCGTPYVDDTGWIGVVTQKVDHDRR